MTSALAGGAAGMAVMTVVLVLLEVQTRSEVGLFAVVARFVGMPGQIFLGFVLFVVAGLLAWPLLFLALEPYLPLGPDPAVRAMVLTAGLWVAFVLAGRGDLSGPILVVYVAVTLLAHLAYGFTLGAVYARLAGVPTR
ncbi:DUF6789 family protein [Halobacteriaceae archaeon GCM10025711]